MLHTILFGQDFGSLDLVHFSRHLRLATTRETVLTFYEPITSRAIKSSSSYLRFPESRFSPEDGKFAHRHQIDMFMQLFIHEYIYIERLLYLSPLQRRLYYGVRRCNCITHIWISLITGLIFPSHHSSSSEHPNSTPWTITPHQLLNISIETPTCLACTTALLAPSWLIAQTKPSPKEPIRFRVRLPK